MGSLPGWMPKLLERLNWACTTSPWFIDLADDARVMERGRKILFDLWPYIRELPENIRTVKDALPESMSAASQLLGRLADGERHYQQLFLQQFELAGVTVAKVEAVKPSAVTEALCMAMTEYCKNRSYVDGIHAIVAAELAATMYCRQSLALYEQYFEKHVNEYEQQLIDSGLEWVRLHAKTHTRHAILMKRMLNDINEDAGDEIPEAAEKILSATLALWECPAAVQVSSV